MEVKVKKNINRRGKTVFGNSTRGFSEDILGKSVQQKLILLLILLGMHMSQQASLGNSPLQCVRHSQTDAV